jgi:hypothetical protein
MRRLAAVAILIGACGGHARPPATAPTVATRPATRPARPARKTPTSYPFAASVEGRRLPSLGITVCDEWIQLMAACILSPAFPEEARDASYAAFLEAIESWARAAGASDPDALAATCEEALASARQSMEGVCPGIF